MNKSTAAVLLALLTIWPAVAAAQWITGETVDPITDKSTVAARLNAAGRPENRTGNPPTLMVLCSPDHTNPSVNITWIVVLWREYMGLPALKHSLQYRFPSAPASTATWERGTDSIIVSSRNAILFLRELVQNERLIMRTRSYRSTLTATFDLAGARAAIEPIAAKCGWQLNPEQKR